ncbi:ROK family transcriptional regulator [Paracoccus sp. TK19116]|uniref:ROK family transcriptional regulator n=1 Tax=Paracoccus albicereus TaxID=2922394 RepID=A0ABT1MY57_9RHOB|nr:ROK family transcriptional regulator [Paracoccus albicereus]MCQ0971806.1 ROK family transcriptional regulator [Paracoccus albicereus]
MILPELSHNERLLLSMIRKEPLPRMALARLMGLSAQALTNISRRLIDLGLLTEGEAVRGKVGQPRTPLAPAPDGALFLGLKLGRRLMELALIDFAGRIRVHRQEVQPHPEPDRIIAFARHGFESITAGLPDGLRDRIAGLGIAAPFRLWDWGREFAGWRDRDICAELAAELPFPVLLENDASSACAGELVFGRSDLPADFLYLYVAHYAGGGLVLDDRLRLGPKRNAGAAGSMPLPGGGQLLDVASVDTLESTLGRALPPDDSGWDVPSTLLDAWISDAGKALAFAGFAATTICDLDAVVIDGAVPTAIRSRIVAATQNAMADLPQAGVDPPAIVEGSLGRSARILGAAALPLAQGFLPEG